MRSCVPAYVCIVCVCIVCVCSVLYACVHETATWEGGRGGLVGARSYVLQKLGVVLGLEFGGNDDGEALGGEEVAVAILVFVAQDGLTSLLCA